MNRDPKSVFIGLLVSFQGIAYLAIALGLAIPAVMLVISAGMSMLELAQLGVLETALAVLDNLLLAFIFVELIETIRIVGGGSQNALLCQFTADACRRRVVAGPVEATALWNILVQAVALGHLPDMVAGRDAVGASVPQTIFEPRASGDWDGAMIGFNGLVAVEREV